MLPRPTRPAFEADPDGSVRVSYDVAGLRAGDVVVSLGGVPEPGVDQAAAALHACPEVAQFLVRRGAELVQVSVRCVEFRPIARDAEDGGD